MAYLIKYKNPRYKIDLERKYIVENAVVLFPDKICVNEMDNQKYNIVATYDVIPSDFPSFNFDVHTIIIMDNYYISEKHIMNIIQLAAERGYNIVSFYKLSLYNKTIVEGWIQQYGTSIDLLESEGSLYGRIYKFTVPIFFVSGMGEYCDQLKTHILLNESLKKFGFNPLNITNSKVAKICGFCNIADVLGSQFKVDIGKSALLIQKINNWIYDKARENQNDVIVISDTNGLFPYDEWRINDFGFYNNVMKYACQYDYVIYNIYSKDYSMEELLAIREKVINVTNTNSVKLGLLRTATTITLPGLYTNEGYINLLEKEYCSLFNDISKFFTLIDSCSKNAINKYVSDLIV